MPESPSAQKPAGQPKLVGLGLTKREQIEKSGKTIFIWVAVAGVVVSLAIVLMQFLVRQALFNQKVINQKQVTSKVLDSNLVNVDGLKRNVDALLVNTSLSQLRVREQDSVLQVIPDALPSSGDPVSFSNSLYNKILQRSGAAINGVSVGAQGVGTTTIAPDSEATQSGSLPTPIALPFSFTATGSLEQIARTLSDMDKVIRPVVVTQLKISAGEGGVLTTVVTGETYYLPSVNIELGKTPVKP